MSKRGQFEVGTVVRIKRTGELAIIRERSYLKDNISFLNYMGEIEGRGAGLYALYDDDLELECLPSNMNKPPEQ